MAQNATLHVKVEVTVANELKRLAKRRNQSVGELVRQAINVCYQPDLSNLSDVQAQALAAYRGSYISLGKFAEKFGLSLLEARHWLNEHNVPQNTCFGEDDARNA